MPSFLRVAVMGAGGVGKSAITVRFITGGYVETYDPTIEDSYRKQFDVDGRPVLLEILDTAGIDQYVSISDLFIRDSDGFVLVFSLDQHDTFDEVRRARETVQRIKAPDGDHVPMVIVGNKADLVDEREVDKSEGYQMAQAAACEYIETSARTNTNILPVFQSIVRQLRAKPGLGRRDSVRAQMKGRKKCVVL